MKHITFLLAVLASPTFATTTIMLEDGTVIETEKRVYISETPLFSLTEATPVTGEPLVGTPSPVPDAEPEDKGSPEWCAWYEDINDGIVAPSFDPNYRVYTENCRS